MTQPKLSTRGAIVGGVVFLVAAALPSLVHGGYAGVMLAGAVLGTPFSATLVARAIIFSGMAIAFLGVGTIFTLGGAVVLPGVSMLLAEASPQGAREARAARRESHPTVESVAVVARSA